MIKRHTNTIIKLILDTVVKTNNNDKTETIRLYLKVVHKRSKNLKGLVE